MFSNEVDNLLNTDELTSYYNDQLQNVLDVVAPVRTRIVSFAHTSPWYTSELRLLKAKGRQLERLYMRSGLTVHKEMYDHHIRDYKDALSTAKTNYYANLINSGGGNTKILFSTMNNILRPLYAFSLHSHSNTTCDAFMNCFSDKIETIHKNLTPNTGACGSFFSLYDASTLTVFSSFYLPTLNEIAECVQKSKSTTCQLDPIPTHLVKFCLPSLLPLITQIIHSSLITGTIPSSFKVAAITPILKKPGADCNDPENLRPKVTNDLLMAADSGLLSILSRFNCSFRHYLT